MMYTRLLFALTLSSVLLALSACVPPGLPRWPVNVHYIRTELHEDGSGVNTFEFAVPNRSGCKPLVWRPAMEKLKAEVGELVSFSTLPPGEYDGFRLAYSFKGSWQIPEQIERIKLAINDATVQTYATPVPTSTTTPVPTPAPNLYVDPKQLSLEIYPVQDTLTGKRWTVAVNINPELITGGPQPAGPAKSCGVPEITYELVMPGEITGYEPKGGTNAIQLTRTTLNSVRWTIQLESLAQQRLTMEARFFATEAVRLRPTAMAIVAQSDPTAVAYVNATETAVSSLPPTEAAHANATLAAELVPFAFLANPTEGAERHATSVPAPLFRLTATSETTAPWFQFLIRVVAPIIALLGGLVGLTLGIFKIRDSFRTNRRESSSG